MQIWGARLRQWRSCGPEEAVHLPLTFRGFRPLSNELIVEVRPHPENQRSRRVRQLTLEIAPSEIRLPAGWWGTETVPVSVRVANSYAEVRDLCPDCGRDGMAFGVSIDVHAAGGV